MGKGECFMDKVKENIPSLIPLKAGITDKRFTWKVIK